MSRVYVGHLPTRCNERDVERFFRGYGKLRDVVLKNGYGFVEFENRKDAEDAVYELHGQELRGERIIVEHARLPPGSRGGSRRGPGPGRDRRYGPPTRTEYRVIVENLSSRVSWQDLKDLMRKAGDVTYADAHKAGRNDGIVEFSSYSDMKDAIEKFDGHELYGRRLRVYEDRQNRRSRSGSLRRSRSDSRTRKRSRSRGSFNRESSRSPRMRRDRSGSSPRPRSESRERRGSHKRRRDSDAANSRSASRRSESHRSRDRSPSHRSDKRSEGPESRSPSRNGKDVTMKETSARRSASRSHSRSRSRSRSRSAASRSPVRSRSASRSRSRSGSRRSRSGSAERHSDGEMNNSRRSEDQDGPDHASED